MPAGRGSISRRGVQGAGQAWHPHCPPPAGDPWQGHQHPAGMPFQISKHGCFQLFCCQLCAMLCHAMLCHAMLCFAMLCYATVNWLALTLFTCNTCTRIVPCVCRTSMVCSKSAKISSRSCRISRLPCTSQRTACRRQMLPSTACAVRRRYVC